jgi:hypothetical protein
MVRIQAAASGMNLLLNGMPLVRYTAKDKAKPVTSGAESWGAACKLSVVTLSTGTLDVAVTLWHTLSLQQLKIDFLRSRDVQARQSWNDSCGQARTRFAMSFPGGGIVIRKKLSRPSRQLFS